MCKTRSVQTCVYRPLCDSLRASTVAFGIDPLLRGPTRRTCLTCRCKKDLRRDPKIIEELWKTSQRQVTLEEVRKQLRHHFHRAFPGEKPHNVEVQPPVMLNSPTLQYASLVSLVGSRGGA